MIDYHPYDVRISGETDVNAHNIEQIEADCKGDVYKRQTVYMTTGTNTDNRDCQFGSYTFGKSSGNLFENNGCGFYGGRSGKDGRRGLSQD